MIHPHQNCIACILHAIQPCYADIDSIRTSHELRNPLSAILQSADSIAIALEEAVKKCSRAATLTLDTSSVDAIAESAATIMTCASHQKRILDDILTMSKLDASLLVVTPCEVDPIATVQHALQLHQQEFKSTGVDGFVRIDPSYSALNVERVFLDPSRLLQVLINLVTNAIKLSVYQYSLSVLLERFCSLFQHPISTSSSSYTAPRSV